MKQIQPVSIWYYGQNKQAILLNMTIISDNLSTQATFFYALYTDPNFQVADGNLTMTGADYITFTTSSDSNEYAYQWGATQLNLTLV